MRKRLLSFNIILAIFISICFSSTVYASNSELSDEEIILEVEEFDDYTIITSLQIEQALTRSSSKTATKSYSCLSNGKVLWSFTLKATFTYNGSSAQCTVATCYYNINDKAWSLSTSTSRSGSKAFGSVTAKEKYLGVTISTISKTLTLNCSASGSIS